MFNPHIAYHQKDFDPADYPRTYVASRGKKNDVLMASAIVGGCGLIGLCFILIGHGIEGWLTRCVLGAPCVAMLLFGIASGINVLRTKCILRADAVDCIDLLKTRSLRRDQVKNWRIRVVGGNRRLELFPLEPRAGKLTIKLTFMPDQAFDAWFKDFPNTALTAQEKAYDAILHDKTLGATPTERLARLMQAKKRASLALKTMAVLSVWTYVYPRPYLILVTACLAMPWIALAIVWRSPNLYTVGGLKNSTGKASLSAFLCLPAIVLGLRAGQDVHLLNWMESIGPGVFAGILMTAVAGWLSKELTKKISRVLMYVVFCSVYAIAALILTNTLFDHRPAAVYPLQVLTKHYTNDRNAHFYLSVSPWGAWGARTGIRDIPVYFNLYRNTSPNDTVCVHLHNGAYGMHWYEAERCTASEAPVVTAQPAAVAATPASTPSIPSTPPSPTAALAAAGILVSRVNEAKENALNESLQLLRMRQYDVLETRLNAAQTAYKSGAIDDLTLLETYQVFFNIDPELKLRYAEWLKAYPDSYAAHLAEAMYYIQIAREARGGRYISDTSDEKISAMDKANNIAWADLDASLKLDDRPLLSYVNLIDISRHYRVDGVMERIKYFIDDLSVSFFHTVRKPRTPNQRDLIDAANRTDPGNIVARRAYMSVLQTRWGHSSAQMNAFAEESQSAPISPEKLHLLEAMVERDRGWNSDNKGDLQGAAKSYAAAVVLMGDDLHLIGGALFTDMLSDAGHAYEHLGQYDKAQVYFKRLLEKFPNDVNGWSNLGVCQAKLHDMEAAAQSFRIAADMGEPIAQNEWGKFLWNGWGSIAKDQTAAVSYFEKSAAQGLAKAKENLDCAKEEMAKTSHAASSKTASGVSTERH